VGSQCITWLVLVFVCVCITSHVSVCLCVCITSCVCVCVSVSVSVSMCVCVCVCLCISAALELLELMRRWGFVMYNIIWRGAMEGEFFCVNDLELLHPQNDGYLCVCVKERQKERDQRVFLCVRS